MLVIEGRARKSVWLNEYLERIINRDNRFDTCVIDYVGVSLILPNGVHYCSKGDDMNVNTAPEDYAKWWKSFIYFKRIVFYVNAPIEMLDKFKEIETKYNKDVVVTIQTEDDNINVYEY